MERGLLDLHAMRFDILCEGIMKWISVDDQLPKTDIEILFVSEGRVKFGEYIWYDPDYRWLDSLVHLYRYDVKYWMPLPKPPTGDDT